MVLSVLVQNPLFLLYDNDNALLGERRCMGIGYAQIVST